MLRLVGKPQDVMPSSLTTRREYTAVVVIDGKRYEDIFKAESRYQATVDAFHTWGPKHVVSIKPKE